MTPIDPKTSRSTTQPWELRFDWTLSVLTWVAVLLGATLSIASRGLQRELVVAAVLAISYALLMQAMPRRLRNDTVVGEVMAVAGVMVGLSAAALTGGIESAYLFFVAVPVFFAAAFLGLRVGMETALLASFGLVLMVRLLDQPLATAALAQAVALYLLIAVTFAQARRILVEEQARGVELAAAGVAHRAQLERLGAAHNLLVSLADLATTAELNPVSVGRAALRDLSLVTSLAAGDVAIMDERGLVVVAQRGDPPDDLDPEVYPIEIGGRRLGRVRLWRSDGGTDAERTLISDALRPVALAFDNILLLKDIARRAVQEERARLARELHDDIGPALVSVGLGIDMGLQQFSPEPDLARHLEATRNTVTRLVDEIRRKVADLRADTPGSLTEHLYSLAADVPADGPAILIELDERRRARSAIAPDLTAIVTEAVRNAVTHSEASTVRISGTVNHDRGSILVEDDGKGFDTSVTPPGHFGLTGMRERGAAIGATVRIESAAGVGTKITVQWGR